MIRGSLIVPNSDHFALQSKTDIKSRLVEQGLLPRLGFESTDWFRDIVIKDLQINYLIFANPQDLNRPGQSFPNSFLVEWVDDPKHSKKSISQLLKKQLKLRVKYGILTGGSEIRLYFLSEGKHQLLLQKNISELAVFIKEAEQYISKSTIREKTLAKNTSQAPLSQTPPPLNHQTKKTQDCHVLGFYHSKGGMGTTTLTVNLAAALRNEEFKVLIIDADPNANTSLATGLLKYSLNSDAPESYQYDLIDLLEGTTVKQGFATRSVNFNHAEIDVIPMKGNHDQSSMQKLNVVSSIKHLNQNITSLKAHYDFIILDIAAAESALTEITLSNIEFLLIPSDIQPFSNRDLPMIVSRINNINKNKQRAGQGSLKILGIVATRISNNSIYMNTIFPKKVKFLENTCQLPVLKSIIHERMALTTCINHAVDFGSIEVSSPQSIFEYSKNNQGAQTSVEEINELAVEVCSLVSQKTLNQYQK